jgi:hypothetical protein
VLDKRLGALGAGEDDQHALAVLVLDDQRLGLGRALEALDRVLLVAHRHEQLLVDQLQHESLGIERAGVDGGKLFFKCVVGDEVHGCRAV